MSVGRREKTANNAFNLAKNNRNMGSARMLSVTRKSVTGR